MFFSNFESESDMNTYCLAKLSLRYVESIAFYDSILELEVCSFDSLNCYLSSSIF